MAAVYDEPSSRHVALRQATPRNPTVDQPEPFRSFFVCIFFRYDDDSANLQQPQNYGTKMITIPRLNGLEFETPKYYGGQIIFAPAANGRAVALFDRGGCSRGHRRAIDGT